MAAGVLRRLQAACNLEFGRGGPGSLKASGRTVAPGSGRGAWLPEDWQPEQRKASVGRDEGQEGKALWEGHGGHLQLRWPRSSKSKQISHYCTDLVGNRTPGHPLSHSGSSSMACYSVSSQGSPQQVRWRGDSCAPAGAENHPGSSATASVSGTHPHAHALTRCRNACGWALGIGPTGQQESLVVSLRHVSVRMLAEMLENPGARQGHGAMRPPLCA